MEKYLSGWIIGCSGGIGNSIVTPLHTICDSLSLFDKSPLLVSDSENSNSKFWLTDFSIEDIADQSCINAASAFGSPEILVVAAGEVTSKDFLSTSSDDIDSLFRNNYLTVFNSLKYFFKHCNKSTDTEKSIVIVSSNAGIVARPNQIVYASFKAAINSLVKSLAKDWGKYNIRINAVAPGTIVVQRNIESLKKKFPNFPYDDNRPISKLSFPQDLTNTFLYLLSRDNPITGQTITVDGGSTL
ncbi:MAG: SDR family oxidoreductase [Bacteroidetes bacterium]|nr:SDR family oxidoreductase [Bacteroidota bacterium]